MKKDFNLDVEALAVFTARFNLNSQDCRDVSDETAHELMLQSVSGIMAKKSKLPGASTNGASGT